MAERDTLRDLGARVRDAVAHRLPRGLRQVDVVCEARALYVLPSWQRQCAEMLRLEVRSGLAERVASERAGECDAGGGA